MTARTDFIVPGDIMRALQATLRHREYEVEKAEAYDMIETGLIVATALAMNRLGVIGWVVCLYSRETNIACVESSTFNLSYTFTGEES